uniref:Serine proteinase inhibitor n=1 Tax=Rhipicephalus sanguineus TaxID=34632 RepID=C9W1P4_RHISA
MYKGALVLILILSNIVPLFAWGAIRPSWFRRTKATTTSRPRQVDGRNRTSYQFKCDGGKSGHCLYPHLCLCPKPPSGTYIRLPKEEFRWYYNKTTQKCEQHSTGVGGCNDFDSEERCNRHCFNVTMRMRRYNRRQ